MQKKNYLAKKINPFSPPPPSHMSDTQSTVWSIPLIKDAVTEAEKVPAIVQKNNMAIYAYVLLSGDDIEGE